MSHLRVIICQVDDDTTEAPVSELSRFDLPSVPVDLTAPLDRIEALVARVGQCVLGRLLERQWEQLDAQAVARYCARQPPGSVVADGYETLMVATRFGSVQLRRQVCAHRDGRPHVMPGNDLLPAHHGLLITRGLQEIACLLAQDVPFATAARLLGWYTDEPGVLSATTVRQLARECGADIRLREQGEAYALLWSRTRGQRLQGVCTAGQRRRVGWPAALSAAVERALHTEQGPPPEGVSWSDWARVRAARAEEAVLSLDDLRHLGPELAPGQMLLVLDEVLTPAQEPDTAHELRTACLLTSDGRRYLSGRGTAFLRQVKAAVQACVDRSLLVVADGARWIRAFFRDHLAAYPQAQMLLDWYHLAHKCHELIAPLWPPGERRVGLRRRLLHALWGGNVSRALRILATERRQGADPQAVATLRTYLQDRAAWIPNYCARRRARLYIGSGLGEQANDRIVARRQKRWGMQWGARSSDALAALRTLRLNDGWEAYWQGRSLRRLTAA